MNRFFLAVLTTVCVLLYTLPALAVEADSLTEEPPPDPVTVETEADDKNIVVNVTLPAPASPEPTPELPADAPAEPGPSFTPYSVSSLDNNPPTDGAAATLADTVTALFGTYTPRTQTVTDHLADGTIVTSQQVIPGVAGFDWPWLTSVALFALLLHGLLRLIGGLIKL